MLDGESYPIIYMNKTSKFIEIDDLYKLKIIVRTCGIYEKPKTDDLSFGFDIDISKHEISCNTDKKFEDLVLDHIYKTFGSGNDFTQYFIPEYHDNVKDACIEFYKIYNKEAS